MSIASGTLTLARATASTAVHAAEAAGGAAVGAVTGAARGTVAGAVSGARGRIDTPTATVLGVAAVGLTGLVEWPIALAAGGVAGTAYLLRRARSPQGPTSSDSAASTEPSDTRIESRATPSTEPTSRKPSSGAKGGGSASGSGTRPQAPARRRTARPASSAK
ncbi:hypothetical protein [Nocardia wallacei]|uniref:hypothetical protein n=1 Tax=Nocardia wallacei TaxID=480035 RepID=UPI0024552209|nr:hypothetical protein [Nocardia wallacei]